MSFQGRSFRPSGGLRGYRPPFRGRNRFISRGAATNRGAPYRGRRFIRGPYKSNGPSRMVVGLNDYYEYPEDRDDYVEYEERDRDRSPSPKSKVPTKYEIIFKNNFYLLVLNGWFITVSLNTYITDRPMLQKCFLRNTECGRYFAEYGMRNPYISHI